MSHSANPSSAKKIILWGAAGVLICFLIVVLYQQFNANAPDPAVPVSESTSSVAASQIMEFPAISPSDSKPVINQSEDDEIETLVSTLSERLRKQFSENIQHIAVQVSLKSLRDDLNKSYPEKGQTLFVRILTNAFPEWVSAILNAISLMDTYETWLQGMLLSLNDMNPLQQQGTLWEKRRELFGDAANHIWQEEISAEQERQLTMNRTMEMLDRSYDTQMQERLYILQKTFEESYADKLQTMLVEPKGVLAQVFFGFDAVQRDLKAMSADARQTQINEIRRTMGFSDEQIKAQEASDQEREVRWQNGYAYMAARKEAETQFSGEQLTQELDRIREKFFAHEASTIKREEEDMDFYRYNRPRVYGRN